MADDTTTDSGVDNQPQNPATDDGQAEETIQASAESHRSDQASQDTSSTEEPAAEDAEDNSAEDTEGTADDAESSDDGEADELQAWAQKKGLDTSDPTKLLKAYREAEKRMHDTTTQTSELKKELTTDNDGQSDDTDGVIQEARVLNFYNSNPEARQYDKEMGQIYARFQNSDPEFAGHLSRHLDTLLAMAKTENNSEQVQRARQEGKNEVIEKSKKARTASAPKANATATQPAEDKWTAEKVDQVIQDGKYSQHRDEILAWERQQLYGIR